MTDVEIIISRDVYSTGKKEEFEENLGKKFSELGIKTTIIPDIYSLRKNNKYFESIKNIKSQIVLFSWYFPRASYWTLSMNNISRKLVKKLENTETSQIICMNLNENKNIEEWLDKTFQAIGSFKTKEPVDIIIHDDVLTERWYPVIDQDKCNNCLECIEYCLFGVFDMGDYEDCIVANPDSCKPGCPACSRVCPTQAIIFPLFEEESAIAGSDEGSIKPLDLDAIKDMQKDFEDGNMTEEDIIKKIRTS